MIARTLVFALLLVTVAVVETSVLPFLPVPGLTPDLLLLITMVVALKDGPQAGLRVGFAAGLLADLLVAQAPLGSATLVLTSIGGIVGTARPYLASQSVTAPLVLAFLTGAAGTAAYGSLSLLLGEDRVTWELLATSALRVGLFNTLLAPIALIGVGRLTARFPMGSAGSEA